MRLPLALLLASLVALPAAAQAASIQPGERLIVGDSRCTLAFIVASATDLYVATAGHCINEGDVAEVPGLGAIGAGAFTVFDDADQRDFALIRIEPQHYASVVPEALHWGGPTGIFQAPGEHLDVVHHVGQGVVFGDVPATQPRSGIGPTWEEGAPDFYFHGTGVSGDSGSPVLHESGLAIGVLVTLRVAGDANTNGGMHIGAGLQAARESGIVARLVLAGEDPAQVMREMAGPAAEDESENAPIEKPPIEEEPIVPAAQHDEPTPETGKKQAGTNRESARRDAPIGGIELLSLPLLAGALWKRRRV